MTELLMFEVNVKNVMEGREGEYSTHLSYRYD